MGVESVRKRIDFEIIARVILPQPFHLLLDPLENDFTGIMQRLKMSFGMRYRKRTGSSSGRIWQHRYWDHVIRDQIDMNRHMDYIHYNPVKHSLVASPFDWEHSSLHRYHEVGTYEAGWGQAVKLPFEGEFGE